MASFIRDLGKDARDAVDWRWRGLPPVQVSLGRRIAIVTAWVLLADVICGAMGASDNIAGLIAGAAGMWVWGCFRSPQI
jgi:hypothetical protein